MFTDFLKIITLNLFLKMINERIPDNIKKFRELKNVTRKAISDHLGMTVNGYAKIEQGNVDVTFKKLEIIAKFLDVELHDIIDFDPSHILGNHVSNKKYTPSKHDTYSQNLSDFDYTQKLIESLERENNLLREKLSNKK